MEDVIEHARYAIEFCRGIEEEAFVEDTRLVFAVARAVEVVGEAARAIPEEVRSLAPEVPWRQIVSTRNKIAHQYFAVKLDVVWNIVQNDLPPLIASMERLLALLEPGDDDTSP